MNATRGPGACRRFTSVRPRTVCCMSNCSSWRSLASSASPFWIIQYCEHRRRNDGGTIPLQPRYNHRRCTDSRVPAVYPEREYACDGELIAYGPMTCQLVALNVTCCDTTIPSLSGDKRTHRDHRQSVARDPNRNLGRSKSAGPSRSTAHFSASTAAAGLSWPRRELPFRAVLEPVLFLKSLVFCRVFGMRWRCLLLKRCPLCEE
jgi:hypothetical protein